MSKRFGAVAVLALMVGLMSVGTAAGKKGAAYQTGFDRWRAADGSIRRLDARRTARTHRRAPAWRSADRPGSPSTDPYAPGALLRRQLLQRRLVQGRRGHVARTSRPTSASREAIASWNADTPDGTWIETQIQAEIAGRWTKWYSLGIWAADYSTIERHSVKLQGDTDGFVAVDTLVLNGKKAPPADAYQLKVRLFSDGTARSRRSGTSRSRTRPRPVAPTTPRAGQRGELEHAARRCRSARRTSTRARAARSGAARPRRRWCSATGATARTTARRGCTTSVDGVFDWIYDGHGNWPFNTAYAATQTTADAARGLRRPLHEHGPARDVGEGRRPGRDQLRLEEESARRHLDRLQRRASRGRRRLRRRRQPDRQRPGRAGRATPPSSGPTTARSSSRSGSRSLAEPRT